MPYNNAHVKKNKKNAQNIWSYQKKIVILHDFFAR